MSLHNPFADQTRRLQFVNKVKTLTPLHDHIIVSDMSFGERFTNSGIVLLGDDGKSSGIRPRWCRVWAVGPDQTTVKVGEWICVAHGRWSRGFEVETDEGKFTLRRVDPNDVLLSSDELPKDDTLSDAVSGNPVPM